MKSTFTGILLSFALFSFSSQAATRQEVSNKLFELRQALQQTFATPEELDLVMEDLNRALQIMSQGSGGGPDQACIDFAYSKYEQSYSSSVALTKAGEACRKTVDLDVARALYEFYQMSYTAGVSMDKSAEGAGELQRGKADIIRYAATQYQHSYTGGVAADKAAAGSARVRRGSLGCLESSFERFYQSYTAGVAMDKAFEFCQ